MRREGLYSSLISEWRKQRDAGVLAGKRPGEKVGRLTAEQAEIARLSRENARLSKRLSTTEAALDIMGKAHALLETLSERADSDEQRKNRCANLHVADRRWCFYEAGSGVDRNGALNGDPAAQCCQGPHASAVGATGGRPGQQAD